MFRNLTIRAKLIIGIMVVVIGAFSVVYFFIANVSEKTLEDIIGGNLVTLAQDVLDDIDKSIYHRIEQAEIYARDISKEKTLRDSNKDFDELSKEVDIYEYIDQIDKEWISTPLEEITPFMKSLIENDLSDEIRDEFELKQFYLDRYGYPIFAEVFITNKYGVNVAQSQKTTDYYQGDEKCWQMAKENNLYVSDVAYDESADVFSTDLCLRINHSENGDFLGVMKVILNIDEIIAIIKDLEPMETREYRLEHIAHGHGGHLTLHFKLINEKGELLYSSTPFKVFDKVSEELWTKVKEESEVSYFIGPGDEPEIEEELFAHRHSKGHKTFKGFKWTFVVEHETEEIFAPIVSLKNILIVIIFSTTIALILFGLIIAYSITQPIKDLSKVVKIIAKGDLSKRAKVKSRDEIGQLASSFNEMADNLQESYETVEEKIEERTKQLEELNKRMVGRELKMAELKKEIKKSKEKS